MFSEQLGVALQNACPDESYSSLEDFGRDTVSTLATFRQLDGDLALFLNNEGICKVWSLEIQLEQLCERTTSVLGISQPVLIVTERKVFDVVRQGKDNHLVLLADLQKLISQQTIRMCAIARIARAVE